VSRTVRTQAPEKQCSFAGAWGGAESHLGRTFYIMSYFFDRCALPVAHSLARFAAYIWAAAKGKSPYLLFALLEFGSALRLL
jgi:hypothetical protein